MGKAWEMRENTRLGIIPLQVQRGSGLFLHQHLSIGAETSSWNACMCLRDVSEAVTAPAMGPEDGSILLHNCEK